MLYWTNVSNNEAVGSGNKAPAIPAICVCRNKVSAASDGLGSIIMAPLPPPRAPSATNAPGTRIRPTSMTIGTGEQVVDFATGWARRLLSVSGSTSRMRQSILSTGWLVPSRFQQRQPQMGNNHGKVGRYWHAVKLGHLLLHRPLPDASIRRSLHTPSNSILVGSDIGKLIGYLLNVPQFTAAATLGP